MSSSSLAEHLAEALGPHLMVEGDLSSYLVDETETRSIRGHVDAVVAPSTPAEVASVVRFAYTHDVPLTVRGGGTGYAGGAVPSDGGIVLSLERLNRIRSCDPFLWRMEVEAGVTTERVHRLARENGLYFPPDPGAGEQSHIGGNIATNAGGPHAFKYGTVGAWVTGLEVVIPPGDVVRLGGPYRKDVAAYDLKRILIGSEGTLGIVTSAWLRLMPMPEAHQVVVAFYPDLSSGVEAIERVLGNGLEVAALEYLDHGSLSAAPPRFLGVSDPNAAFAVLCEVDGSSSETSELAEAVNDVLSANASIVFAPSTPTEAREVWRWREGLTAAVTAQRGGKVSEDIVVPLDRLAEAIARTIEIGLRAGLAACSWGHAGDGNLHSTFLVDRENPDELLAAEHAAQDLFHLAIALGGSISGEHGIGLVKRGHLQELLGRRGYELHRGIKNLFDPKGLLNPSKKI
jgi:glycolate oxidase subunit GlcD